MFDLEETRLGSNMAFLENAQLSFKIWSNGLDAADSAALGAIGFGLIIFSVVALLLQRHFEKRTLQNRESASRPGPCRPVLGLRHSRGSCSESKSGGFLTGQKKDPFLSRLERLV